VTPAGPAVAAPRLRSERRSYALLAALLFVTFAFFYQGGGGNQNVRVLQIRALIEGHTFAIDAYRDDMVSEGVWKPFVLTEDWSFAGGHYYPNKSPGISLWGAPSFALADAALSALAVDARRRAQWDAYFTTVCTVGVAATLLGLLMFWALRSLLRLGEAQAFWATACFSFGTLCFSYSSVFQCHQPAACSAFASFLLAVRLRERPERSQALAAGSGAAGALAVLFEPSCILTLAAVGAYLASFREGRRGLFAFVLGCVPAGALQLGYNWACFGSPLTSSYALSNPAIMFAVEGKTFSFPTPVRLCELLLSPARGLFVTSPLLILAIPGGRALLGSDGGRLGREAWTGIGASVALVLMIASFSGWHGGAAAGPRYLLPAFPFLFLLAAAAMERYPRTFGILGAVGVAINLAITAVGNELGPGIGFPVGFALERLAAGRVSVNPVPVPWPGWTDAYPSADAAVRTWRATTTFHSFNMGQIILPQSPVSVLPLLLLWGALGYRELVRSRARG
jgi:hypothetical protein